MSGKENSQQACSEQLMELVPMLARLIRRGIRRADPLMSPPQVRILDFLLRTPGMSLSDLSYQLDITNATASSHIDKLVKRGLVQRAENPSERRRVMLTLTASGKKSLETMKAVSVAALSEMLATVPPSKLQRIQEGLSILEESGKRLYESQS